MRGYLHKEESLIKVIRFNGSSATTTRHVCAPTERRSHEHFDVSHSYSSRFGPSDKREGNITATR
jgi:hypothetical protein